MSNLPVKKTADELAAEVYATAIKKALLLFKACGYDLYGRQIDGDVLDAWAVVLQLRGIETREIPQTAALIASDSSVSSFPTPAMFCDRAILRRGVRVSAEQLKATEALAVRESARRLDAYRTMLLETYGDDGPEVCKQRISEFEQRALNRMAMPSPLGGRVRSLPVPQYIWDELNTKRDSTSKESSWREG